ncbi:MAG: transposase, partial [Erysipelotrichaceae bacterium]|nr:transposase [Erysipelotrichaceae bacterium]
EIEKVIGLDYSMHDLFVASEEDVQVDQKHLHHYRKSLEQLAKEQRILSHRKKGSKRYEKQRIKVAKIHEKIANQRKDILHKSSRQIANTYDLVCVENLNMKNMSQELNFGKSVTDNGWGMFVSFLEYKLEDLGKQLVKIDKWYPSSKTCHICGCMNEELTLNIRQWECPICHQFHDRDQNAAQNIKKEGMRIAFQ